MVSGESSKKVCLIGLLVSSGNYNGKLVIRNGGSRCDNWRRPSIHRTHNNILARGNKKLIFKATHLSCGWSILSVYSFNEGVRPGLGRAR